MNPESRQNTNPPLDARGASGQKYSFNPDFSAKCDALFNPAPLPPRASAEVDTFHRERLSFLISERFGEDSPVIVYLGSPNQVSTDRRSNGSLSRPFIAGFPPEHQQDPGHLAVGFYVPETDGVRLVQTPGLTALRNQLISTLQLSRFLETALNCHDDLIPLFLDFQLTGRTYLELEDSVAPRSLANLTRTPLSGTEACLRQCQSLGITVCSDDLFQGIARGVVPLSCLPDLGPLGSLKALGEERQLPAVISRMIDESRQRVLFSLLPRYSEDQVRSRHPWIDAHAELIRSGLPQFRMTVIGEGSGAQRVEDFIQTLGGVSSPLVAHAQTNERANDLWAGARELPRLVANLCSSIATLSQIKPVALDQVAGVVDATEALAGLERHGCRALRTLVQLHHLSSVEVDEPGPQEQLERAVGAAAGLVTCTRRELDRYFPGLFRL